MKILARVFFALVASIAAHFAAAGPYPEAPISIIVPYPAGGTSDYFARYVARHLHQVWSVQVVVEPKPGAGGNIGSDFVAKSNPDGYTLLLGAGGSNAVNPALFKNMPYDARTELVLVAPVSVTANVLVASPRKPFKSVRELIAHARAHPGGMTYASSGNGSVLHLSGELLKVRTGVDILHIPYKGTPPALVDVLTGRVDFMVANAPSVIGQLKSHSLKALAVTGATRSATLPDVPTMQESGVPNYDLSSWFGVMTPSGTPSAVVQTLNAEITRMLKLPKTVADFATQGAEPLSMGRKESAQFFLDEIDKWAEIVRISKARVD